MLCEMSVQCPAKREATKEAEKADEAYKTEDEAKPAKVGKWNRNSTEPAATATKDAE